MQCAVQLILENHLSILFRRRWASRRRLAICAGRGHRHLVPTENDHHNLLGMDGAHLHCGPIDGGGPVVAFLAQPVTGGRTEAQVGFSGFIDVTGIVDTTCGATIDLLYETIVAGGTYVNVHSTENIDGEVRGQILIPALEPTSSRKSAHSASPNLMFRSAFIGLLVALVAVAAM
jgi:hypothetical protein